MLQLGRQNFIFISKVTTVLYLQKSSRVQKMCRCDIALEVMVVVVLVHVRISPEGVLVALRNRCMWTEMQELALQILRPKCRQATTIAIVTRRTISTFRYLQPQYRPTKPQSGIQGKHTIPLTWTYAPQFPSRFNFPEYTTAFTTNSFFQK